MSVRAPVYVVTGASGGIGRSVVLGLARSGPSTLVLVARRRGELERLAGSVAASFPSVRAEARAADLTLLAEVRRLGGELRAAHPRIDALVNNAGAWFHHREETAEGIERTWALNVLAPVALAESLRASLGAAAPSRVVMVASEAHRGHRLRLDDLEGRKGYRGFRNYGRSKLALIELTRQLAERYRPDGISVNSVHPGFIASGFGQNNRGWVGTGMRLLEAVAGRSPEYGARGILRCALDPGLATTTGAYFVRSRPARPSRAADTPGQAEALWADCAGRLGIAGGPGGPGPSAASAG